MATASSLINRIHYVLGSLGSVSSYRFFQLSRELRRGLWNLNLLLICLRNTGNDDISHVMRSLFSRIEDEVGRISTDFAYQLSETSVDEINCLVKEVSDEGYTNTMPNCLTLDDAIEVAGSIMLSADDFYDEMDEFEVQIRFLRDFLLFAKQTGVENQQMHNLLIHLRLFVLDAARHGTFNADWVEEVKSKFPRVYPQVFQAYTQTLLSITMLDQIDDVVLKDFLSSLISLLWHVLRYRHHHSLHSDSLKSLYECLRLSRFNLKQWQQNNNGNFKDHIGVLIRDAGIIICSVYLSDVDSPRLSDLLQRFDDLRAQLHLESNISNANALGFYGSIGMEDISDVELQINVAVPSHQSSSTPPDAGFQEDEVTLIVDRLTRGSKQLRLVPISGMMGIGKTTFALKVYNQSSIIYHFQVRAWCTISQIFDKKRVLRQLLNQIQPGNYSNTTEDDLANKLRQSLKGKRYLILLDDVWTLEVWESLRPSFQDDRTESRMILTSRLHTIIPQTLSDEQPHFLRLRNENECLEIIELKLLHKEGPRTELKTFAKLCRGLPLTAVLIAGLLAVMVQQGWEGILDHLNSGGITRMEQCKIALELSYENLPDELKLCFIYFGVFPEDEEIHARKLISLWMAEGFVAQTTDLLKKGAEDVAREYLDKLIQRNLVMIAKERSMGGVKTCRIHDLLHDFCLIKGKQENLFHVLEQVHDEISDFNEPCNLERLSIHSDARHFKESMLFCPRAHSMLFFHYTGHASDLYLPDMLFIIQIYKLLRVLDLELIQFSTGVPSEIALLTQLTHLSICCLPVIPASIGNLSNLETLIIQFYSLETVSLPHTIWYLQKLKYLRITWLYGSLPAFSLPIENIESYPSLLKLEVISGIVFDFDGSMEKQMRKFPNIRRLKGIIRGVESSEELNNIIVVPEYLNKLESITLGVLTSLQHNLDFGSGESLRKVTLQDFVLSREEIAVLGKLPTLEVLKLLGISFFGGTMDMEEGEFTKLRILALMYSRNLEMWTATGEEQLPCLEKLTFSHCTELKEIPYSCLENVSTLGEIEVHCCSSALESFVRGIEEVQKDFGNLIRVQIYSEEEEEEEE